MTDEAKELVVRLEALAATVEQVPVEFIQREKLASMASHAAALIRSLSERVEKLEGAGVHLCAAVDNLWNHPDLVRVRAEIPESIKLNISRGQMMTRAALERK